MAVDHRKGDIASNGVGYGSLIQLSAWKNQPSGGLLTTSPTRLGFGGWSLGEKLLDYGPGAFGIATEDENGIDATAPAQFFRHIQRRNRGR